MVMSTAPALQLQQTACLQCQHVMNIAMQAKGRLEHKGFRGQFYTGVVQDMGMLTIALVACAIVGVLAMLGA